MNKHLKQNSSNKLDVTVATSFEQIEALRNHWQQMQAQQPQPTPNADIDRYLATLRARNGKAKPWIIVFTRNNLTTNMVIGRIEKHQLRCRIGYITICKPSLRCLSIVYGGILGEQNQEICSRTVTELQNILKAGTVDLVYLSHLRTNSIMFQTAKKKPNIFCRDHFTSVCPHWQSKLANNAEDFSNNTLSRNDRRNLRRYIKRLEEKSSSNVKMVSYQNASQLEVFTNAASHISSRTYHAALEVGFSNNNETHCLLRQAAQDGWLRAFVLYAGNKPVAFESGSVYRGVYFAEYRGFDPDWKTCSPGTALLLKVLETLSSEPNTKTYDYGYGDAPYKRRYGHKSWPEASVYIFAPRFYPVFINTIQFTIRALYLLVNFLTTKFGINQLSKRHWRNLLQKKTLKKQSPQ